MERGGEGAEKNKSGARIITVDAPVLARYNQYNGGPAEPEKGNIMEIKVENGRANVKTPYNVDFVSKIKNVGGSKWEPERKCWSVPAESINQVREIMMEVYGRTDQTAEKTCTIRLTFSDALCEYRAPVTIYGKTIASAFGRDSGARVGDDVAFVDGGPTSGGSAKNWTTIVPAGSVVVLYNVPEPMLSRELPAGVTAEVVPDEIDRVALLQERERLLARLAEIDALLEEEYTC